MGKKDSDSEATQRTEVPGFLRPFVQRQAKIGTASLGRLEGLLGGAGAEDLVAGFDPLQEEAFDLAAERARGAGGFLPTAERTFLETAEGVDPGSFVDPAAFEALQSTAGGDFLFGGEGFQAAVDAAVRAAQPGILSTFGRAGGAPGGLARAAIGKSATDAFASQFGAERGRQLQASGILADLGSTERGRRLAAAGALPGLATAGAGILEGLGAKRQGQRQRELSAPISAQEALLSAATGGGIPLSALLGSSQSGPGSNPATDIAGGALALAPFLFDAFE